MKKRLISCRQSSSTVSTARSQFRSLSTRHPKSHWTEHTSILFQRLVRPDLIQEFHLLANFFIETVDILASDVFGLILFDQ